MRVPRDRNGEYEPKILRKYASNSNELEEEIIGLYAKGLSTRDIQDTLHDLYGVEISAQSISTITDKIWSLVEAYHRQLRRVTKTKSSFPSPEAARKLLYLATVDITRKWTMPIRNWLQVLNQLVIRFENRIDF